MSSFGKFVLGTLVGGAIGAALGLLLAPRSGRETRELIREEFNTRYSESVETVKDKAEAVKHRIKEQADHLEEAGRRMMGKISHDQHPAEQAPIEPV
jgi:gas vesicle protein